MATREAVYAAISTERDYQKFRAAQAHPENPEEHKHSVNDFVVYMDDYLTEVKHILSREWGPDCERKALESIRKVTALGVACMEQNGAPSRVF